jgi:hypothetical protein
MKPSLTSLPRSPLESTSYLPAISTVESMLPVGLWLCSTPLPRTFNSHQGSSTIDLFATSLPVGSIILPKLIEGRSIHLFRNHVPVALAISVPRQDEEVAVSTRLSRVICQDQLRGALMAMQGSMKWVTGDVEAAARLLSEAIVGAIPLLPPRDRRAQPWFNAHCYILRILFLSHDYMRPLFLFLRRAYKVCIREHRATWHQGYE